MLCTLAAISYIITFLIYIHYIITSLVFCPSPFFFCVHVCGRVLFCYCCCCCSLVHSVNCLWIFNTTLLPSQQSLFDVVVVIVVIVRHTFFGGGERWEMLYLPSKIARFIQRDSTEEWQWNQDQKHTGKSYIHWSLTIAARAGRKKYGIFHWIDLRACDFHNCQIVKSEKSFVFSCSSSFFVFSGMQTNWNAWDARISISLCYALPPTSLTHSFCVVCLLNR